TEGKLYSIPGSPPDLMQKPKGDAFAPRNEFALAIDYEKQPPMFPVSDTHSAATWLLHHQAPNIKLDNPPSEKSQEKTTDKRYDKQALLEAINIKKHFKLDTRQTLKAVDGISLKI